MAMAMAVAKLLLGSVFLLFLTATTTPLLVVVEGREFIVGGRVHAWKAPAPAAAAAAHQQSQLSRWASSMRFQVGDTLVWVLGGSQKDSVLEVARSDYLTCNTSSPLADHTYGTARVRLDRPGPYYFISGINGACQKGEKLAVLVMGPHHPQSPSPSPSPSTGFDDVVVGAAGPASAPPTSGVSSRMLVGAANVVGLGLLMLLLLGLGLL